MSAMYRLKAYFGMVPAGELADYADGPVDDRPDPHERDPHGYDRLGHGRPPADRHAADRHATDRHATDRQGRRREQSDWDERFTSDEEPPERPRVSDEWERRTALRPEPFRGPSGATPTGPGPGAVRGALAVDPDAVRPAPPVLVPLPPAVPEQRDRAAAGPVRITTLQPASYKEARTIGEHYREGQPVIMNLTELDAADAKRLVDFAAGLAFALRGSIDKVTNRVFLLTPADVEVSADDARRLVGDGRADGGGPGRVGPAQRSTFRSD